MSEITTERVRNFISFINDYAIEAMTNKKIDGIDPFLFIESTLGERIIKNNFFGFTVTGIIKKMEKYVSKIESADFYAIVYTGFLRNEAESSYAIFKDFGAVNKKNGIIFATKYEFTSAKKAQIIGETFQIGNCNNHLYKDV